MQVAAKTHEKIRKNKEEAPDQALHEAITEQTTTETLEDTDLFFNHDKYLDKDLHCSHNREKRQYSIGMMQLREDSVLNLEHQFQSP